MENIIVKLKQIYMTKEVEMIIEDKVNTVILVKDYIIPTNNGVISKSDMHSYKQKVMAEATEYLVDSLVKHNQDYPERENSLVTFKLNCVILTREDYNKLIKNIK